MGVDKVILKAFLSTLAAIAAMFVILLGVLLMCFPATMMDLTYSLGMESWSITQAKRAYGRGEDIHYIAKAMETAIEIEDFKQIEVCGLKMIADEDFIVYCAEKDENSDSSFGEYDDYIYGEIGVAKYNRGKKTEAIEFVFANTQETAFPKNNAIVAVLLTSLRDGDMQTANLIKGKMEERLGKLSQADRAYCEELLGLISK